MKTCLAWRNLAHNKLRFGAAVAGVMFAVLLIFMQLGFLGATQDGASRIYEFLDFDLVIRSKGSRRLSESKPFPRSRLDLAASVAEVREVYPFYIGFQTWRIPRGRHAGYGRHILILGVKPGDPVFLPEEMQVKTALLTDPCFALIDRRSRAEFGPRGGKSFGDEDIGVESEVGARRVRLVGHYGLGASFEADGSLVVSDEGFLRLCPEWTSEVVSLGLVKLRGGQVNADADARRIRRILLPDVEVSTRSEAIARQRHMWMWEMSIGMIFVMGVVVALSVGVAIVYQILSSDVSSRLPEYATLKAMGYRDSFLGAVVLQQAVILALCGFLPGLAAAEMLYWLATSAANIPIRMTLQRVVFVLVMTVLMCGVSGLAALRELRKADPAELF